MDQDGAASQNSDPEPIKRSFIINKDIGPKYEQASSKGSGLKTFLMIGLLAFLLVGGFLLFTTFNVVSKISSILQPNPVATPTVVPTSTPVPTPVAPVLEKSEWSFEVLNGSGITGAAKKIADKVQSLGYSVVKTGNADKSNYAQTQILVRQEFQEKIDLVIADLKDVIKIATVAGELKEGTASARIIIGKDSI